MISLACSTGTGNALPISCTRIACCTVACAVPSLTPDFFLPAEPPSLRSIWSSWPTASCFMTDLSKKSSELSGLVFFCPLPKEARISRCSFDESVVLKESSRYQSAVGVFVLLARLVIPVGEQEIPILLCNDRSQVRLITSRYWCWCWCWCWSGCW